MPRQYESEHFVICIGVTAIEIEVLLVVIRCYVGGYRNLFFDRDTVT